MKLLSFIKNNETIYRFNVDSWTATAVIENIRLISNKTVGLANEHLIKAFMNPVLPSEDVVLRYDNITVELANI